MLAAVFAASPLAALFTLSLPTAERTAKPASPVSALLLRLALAASSVATTAVIASGAAICTANENFTPNAEPVGGGAASMDDWHGGSISRAIVTFRDTVTTAATAANTAASADTKANKEDQVSPAAATGADAKTTAAAADAEA